MFGFRPSLWLEFQGRKSPHRERSERQTEPGALWFDSIATVRDDAHMARIAKKKKARTTLIVLTSAQDFQKALETRRAKGSGLHA